MSRNNDYLCRLARMSNENNNIVEDMYLQHHVNRGLRDLNGNGVVTGLTEISKIISKEKDVDGNTVSCDGRLYYRGTNIRDIVQGFWSEKRFGFEEAVYLLLFSKLPDKAELETEKAQIEELLCSGTLSVDELTEKSKRLPEVNDLTDEKTMRWLELSEIEG